MSGMSREFTSAILVFALMGVISLAFPFSAIKFRPSPQRTPSSASAAFVRLTDAERANALKAAKTAWQTDESEKQGVRLRLPLGELPEAEQDTLFHTCELLPERVTCDLITSRLPPWEPSQKAGAPVRLAAEEDGPKQPAFSREELLKLK